MRRESSAATSGAGSPSATVPTGGGASVEPRAGTECDEGFFADDGACVALPDFDGELPLLSAMENIHRERSGRWAIYEQIPRMPERPANYDRYRYPIPSGLAGGHTVISGYDLDLGDERQRRGKKLHAVGHGGLDLPAPRGTPIKLIHLEHEQGETQIVYVGHLFGNTVVTKHTVREAGRLRDYVLLYGHLDRPEPGLAAHRVVLEGETIGYVGDSDSPSLVHLHLEARRVREEVDILSTPPSRLLDRTVVCDARNVLPLRE